MVSFANASSKINIDVDLGGASNFLEKVGDVYHKAFVDDKGFFLKSDVRLRNAKNASLSGETTQDGLDAIYKISKGQIIPVNSENAPNLTSLDLSSTENNLVKKIDFTPTVQIYSSNNIQIKRGYLFSQEFLKFFNLNLLLEGVKHYDNSTSSDQEKAFNLVLLDKFNIRSFSFFYDYSVDNNYDNILNGLTHLEIMIDEKIKEQNYRNLLKNKIETIRTLLKVSKAIYDNSKNSRVPGVKIYTLRGNNKLLKPFFFGFSIDVKKGIVPVFYTPNKNNWYVDKTHLYQIRTGNTFCVSEGYGEFCPYLTNNKCYNILKDNDGTYYYINESGLKKSIPSYLLYLDDESPTCFKTKRCTYSNKPGQSSGAYEKKQWESNCIYSADISTLKKATNNVLSSLSSRYNDAVDNIVSKTGVSLGIGSDIKSVLSYLTNNIPNLTDVLMTFTESFVIRNVNAIYRDENHVNVLDYMDDIQEVIGIKQYRYNKDLDVARKFKVALSLTDFANNSINKKTPEQLKKEIKDSITVFKAASEATKNGTADTPVVNSELYTPVDVTSITSAESASEGTSSVSSLSRLPAASTQEEVVVPNKILTIYLNSFNSGVYKIIFGNRETANLINSTFGMNNDASVYENYNIFAYGTDKNGGYFLGKTFLNKDEQKRYLENSFALFGIACTEIGGDDSKVCSLKDRHINDEDNWIGLGANNYKELYKLTLQKLTTLANVNIVPEETVETLNEVMGIIIDNTTGERADKLANILNGKSNESMQVDTFMPFKGQGILVQNHYAIKHYTIKPITKTVETKDADGNTTTTTVVRGYKWVLQSTDYPNYSCGVGFTPTSRFSIMLIKKVYPNYAKKQITSDNVVYSLIGQTSGIDFGKLLGGNSNSDASVFSNAQIGLSYAKYVNPSLNYAPSAADCLAHGLSEGCTLEDIGMIFNCSDIGDDDFWRTHAVIQYMPSINVGNKNSKLIYRHDVDNITDKTKNGLTDTDSLLLYGFDGKIPEIGTAGFSDSTNVYKKIFIDGAWKDTVVTNTIDIDTGETAPVSTIYDCAGTLQTTMCSDDQLPEVGETENKAK
jgi:hypothetical protein